MALKVMTYNIQHGLDYKKLLNKERIIDLDKIYQVIKDENIDLVGLNEVYNDVNNIETVEQVKYLANKLGFNYYFFGQSITLKNVIGYGNAIISKYPLTNYKIHKIDDPIIKDEDTYYESRIIIECDLLINNESIKVFITHLGLAKSEKINGTKKLLEVIKDKEKIILLGDFNMEEDNNNIILLSNELFNTSKLIEGCKCTYTSVNPKEKIDYIFVKGIDVISSKVVKKIASDHYPVVCEIKL